MDDGEIEICGRFLGDLVRNKYKARKNKCSSAFKVDLKLQKKIIVKTVKIP